MRNDPAQVRLSAEQYLKRSWCPIPVGCDRDGKAPEVDSWLEYQGRLPTAEEIAGRGWSGGVGTVLREVSYLVVLDIDVLGAAERLAHGWARELLGEIQAA